MKPIKQKFKITGVEKRLEEDYGNDRVTDIEVTKISLTEITPKKRGTRIRHKNNRHMSGLADIEVYLTNPKKAEQFRLGSECLLEITPLN